MPGPDRSPLIDGLHLPEPAATAPPPGADLRLHQPPAPSPSPSPRASRGTYRVLEPGARGGPRQAAPGQSPGPQVQPPAGGERYPMRPGPRPRTTPVRPFLEPTEAARPFGGTPRWGEGSDLVQGYQAMRPQGAPAAPMETYIPPPDLHARPPVFDTAPAAAEAASMIRGPIPGPLGGPVHMAPIGPRTRAMLQAARPTIGTPTQAAGAIGATLLAQGVNHPDAIAQIARAPVGSAAGLAGSVGNAVIHPGQSWVPEFTTGAQRLMSGEVGGGELAAAAGNATGILPVYQAGRRMGDTLQRGFTDPRGLAKDFGRGVGVLGNALIQGLGF